MKEIQGATVVDTKGKDHLTKFVLPVSDTTNDARPRQIEQRGNQLTNATRRERLQPYANELISFLRRKGAAVTAATASKHLREQPGFTAAMGNVPSFGRESIRWMLADGFTNANLVCTFPFLPRFN